MMSTSRSVRIGFEKKAVELPLKSILPIRRVTAADGCFGKYRSVLASIRTIGLVEPLVVYPNRATRGSFLLLDGHMRMKALEELGKESALCLVSIDDDAFTYNDKVNRLAVIQEHRMIVKAIEGGVSEEEIAKALDMDVKTIRSRQRLLDGLDAEAVQILKDKPISDRALGLLRRVKALRQIEMAQLMVSGNNYTFSYVRALLIGTNREQMVKPEEPKTVRGMSIEDVTRMEKEMESMEQDFRLFQDKYGENTLHLGAAQRYVRKLLENAKVKRFLNQRHPEILEELQDLAALEAL